MAGRLARLWSPRPSNATRGHLMGMYLTETNLGTRSRVRGSSHQQRREGKFAQNRQRA